MTMYIPKAPTVTSLAIAKLSGNQVQITWDDVGSNFYYMMEIKQLPSNSWVELGYTQKTNHFIGDLEKLTSYAFRIQTVAEGFESSDWIETEEFETFSTNVYNFSVPSELNLVSSFVKNHFTDNEKVLNFNSNLLCAALMREDFVYSPYYENISSIKDKILVDNEYHEIQSDITKICKDINRVYLMESNGVLYLFERYQSVVKVSNDKGQSWKAIKLLPDRLGYPVSRTVFSQTNSTNYVLGYEKLFYGRQSSDIRFSSDTDRFSSRDLTFAKLGDTIGLNFEVDIYSSYATLPSDVSKIAEAMVATNEYAYVVARDTVRKIKLGTAPIDNDSTSPTYAERLFEDTVSNITGNPRSVVYKMDTLDGAVFALVIGEVNVDRQDPRDLRNVNSDSEYKGVYKLNVDTDEWTRVYGNTQAERDTIEPGYTSMSVSNDELYISASNIGFTDEELIEDEELVASNDNVSSAVKYQFLPKPYHDKHHKMLSIRTNAESDFTEFKLGRMKYYAEPFFSRSTKSNTLSWISNENKIVIVYSDVEHSKVIDSQGATSPNRIVKEIWVDGDCTIKTPNIRFDNFNQYAGGMMFYDYATGNLVGYYDFGYRVKDSVEIIWRPENTFLSAKLLNQVREEVYDPDADKSTDPDLVPLLRNTIPESYLIEDSNFEKFCEYYLQYISDGVGTPYNNLLNLINNKYPRAENSWEYLWSEVYKRNIYLNKDKRDAVTRFFETRKNDFYSTKGTEASYKFLFKLLYNEDVELEIESKNTTEYYITIDSPNLNADLVGKTIFNATGRANVSNMERDYTKEGKLRWKVSIHNMIGRFIEGQSIASEGGIFSGDVVLGIKAKDVAESTNFADRARSYYVMKIKSKLPTSKYKDDVVRFVHPVGFGFIGITLITIFINSGLALKHVESIINPYKNYRWSDGLPSHYPGRSAQLENGIIVKDEFDVAVYSDHPKALQEFPITPDYDEHNPELWCDLKASERRKVDSLTFDQSAATFANWRLYIDRQLKDNVGNHRDPTTPTQMRIDNE